MTDLEKFVELYKSFDINLKVIENEDDFEIILSECAVFDDPHNEITSVSPKFGGYTGFFSQVVFDKNGKFVCQKFYE